MFRMWLGILLVSLGALSILVLILAFCVGASLSVIGWALSAAAIITIIGIILVAVQLRMDEIDQEDAAVQLKRSTK